jgi:hypothetical protein
MVGMIAALVIWAAVVLTCAALTRPGGRRRDAAIALALAGMPAAFLVPSAWIFARFMLALLTALALGRSLDLALRKHSLSYGARVWMYVALFDVRRVRRGSPGLDHRELAWVLVHLGLLGLGWLGVFEWASGFDDWRRWPARWMAGLLLCYGLIESVHSTLLILYRAVGIEHERINVFPVVSTTLVEFWGRRWNRVVAGWLRDYAFLPLARRGRAQLGIAAAFLGSTALHFWSAAVPLGVASGLTMGSFFVVHGAALMLERRLDVVHWPTRSQRAWTIAIVVVTSPLFVEPMLRILAALATC